MRNRVREIDERERKKSLKTEMNYDKKDRKKETERPSATSALVVTLIRYAYRALM